jgi:hypothetical protein
MDVQRQSQLSPNLKVNLLDLKFGQEEVKERHLGQLPLQVPRDCPAALPKEPKSLLRTRKDQLVHRLGLEWHLQGQVHPLDQEWHLQSLVVYPQSLVVRPLDQESRLPDQEQHLPDLEEHLPDLERHLLDLQPHLEDLKDDLQMADLQ